MGHYIVHLKLGKLWKGGGGGSRGLLKNAENWNVSRGRHFFFWNFWVLKPPPPPPPKKKFIEMKKKLKIKKNLSPNELLKGVHPTQHLLPKFIYFWSTTADWPNLTSPWGKEWAKVSRLHTTEFEPGTFAGPRAPEWSTPVSHHPSELLPKSLDDLLFCTQNWFII